jgi:quinoprotein glucose dehydrogenase
LPRFITDGFHKLLDPDGYPGVVPPWGTLNAIELDTGRYHWRVPLGEYPTLAAAGTPTTGSENYGGPVVTAGGIVFIGATIHDRKFRAFDARTGALLWETVLPTSATATPAVYSVNGRQFVVIAVGSGRTPGIAPHASYVAFALPESAQGESRSEGPPRRAP